MPHNYPFLNPIIYEFFIPSQSRFETTQLALFTEQCLYMLM